MSNMTRRELLAGLAAAPLLRGAATATVAVAKCATYSNDEVLSNLRTMFDQIGGLGRIVRNKTVTVKINMTGDPAQRFEGRALGTTHYTNPQVIGATAKLMGDAGAKRIRFVESGWALSGPLEDYMLDSGWNVKSIQNAAANVTFENTNNRGDYKDYARFRVPGTPYMFPAYDLNRAYMDTDVFVSMAKLKNHAVCGVTLSMKNCFGITPASIYGDDAGPDEPNEKPRSGRLTAMHDGKRAPSKSALSELHPDTPRVPGYRMPRIVAELNRARPVDLAIIDGVETVSGGEGPWISGLKYIKPGVLIAGTNACNTDTVAAAVMGYEPRAAKGTGPFKTCDNTLLLAETLGVGSADLKQIEVAGVPIAKAVYRFGV